VANGGMKILFKYPTRGRPDWFKRTLELWLTLLSPHHEAIFLVAMDDDDWSMNNPTMQLYLNGLQQVAYYYKPHKNKIEAYNSGLEDRQFDVIMPIADDLLPQCESYDCILAAAYLESWPKLNGAIHFNDGRTRRNRIGHPIIGRVLYDNLGYLTPPHYAAWSDREHNAVLVHRKALKHYPMVLFRHEWQKYGPDDTYNRADKRHGEDKRIFLERKKAGLIL